MIQTVEAVVDAAGRVQLLGEIHVASPRRALLTVLDEPCAVPGESISTEKSTAELETSHRRTFRLRTLLLAVAVAALLLGLLRPLYMPWFRPAQRKAQLQRLEVAFASRMVGYAKLAQASESNSLVRKKGVPPRIRGKVLVLDHEDGPWRVSDVQLSLPADLRAEGPGDVDTLVCVKYTGARVGKYLNGKPAFQFTASLSIVDMQDRQVTGRMLGFKGGEPPPNPPGDGTLGFGPKPTEELAAYLIHLPRDEE